MAHRSRIQKATKHLCFDLKMPGNPSSCGSDFCLNWFVTVLHCDAVCFRQHKSFDNCPFSAYVSAFFFAAVEFFLFLFTPSRLRQMFVSLLL